jgi:hypothetical protein
MIRTDCNPLYKVAERMADEKSLATSAIVAFCGIKNAFVENEARPGGDARR